MSRRPARSSRSIWGALQPDVVVTYDPTGGYEHPDHIQTHRVTMAALRQLADGERPAYAFHVHTPRSWVLAGPALAA